MLAVISPWKGTVFWLDPTGQENEIPEFVQGIILAYVSFIIPIINNTCSYFLYLTCQILQGNVKIFRCSSKGYQNEKKSSNYVDSTTSMQFIP